jgi:hypothetical protein
MWFKAKCPVNLDQKEWLEDSMLWLHSTLRNSTFCSSPMVIPNDDFFPMTYQPTKDGANTLLKRVAKLMDVPPSSVSLKLYSEGDKDLDGTLPYVSRDSMGSAGHFQLKKKRGKYVIGIEKSGLSNPFSLVATLAHEVGHVILLGGGLLKASAHDHEYMTDLLTVYLGFGIFTANNAFEFSQWSSGFKSGWSAKRTGYLSESMFGYALALYARMKGDSKPSWETHLDRDIRIYFKKSARYISRSDNCRVKNVCEDAI